MAGLPAGRHFVIVDSATSGAGAYSLTMERSPVEEQRPEDHCDRATAFPGGDGERATLAGSLSGARDDFHADGCPVLGGDTFHTLHLEEPRFVRISADGSQGLALLESCPPGAQIACAPPGRALAVSDLPAGDYVVAVEAGDGAASGPYELLLELSQPVGPDVCVGALDVGEGGLFDGDTSGAAADYQLADATSCTQYRTLGGDEVWRLELREGQRLFAELSTPTFDGALYAVSDCDALADPCPAGGGPCGMSAACLAGADIEGPGDHPEVIDFVAEESQSVWLIVDSPFASERGAYQLEVGVDPTCGHRADATCPVGEVCQAFRCVRPQCEAAADCGDGPVDCVDGRCVTTGCESHAECAHNGEYCLDAVCASPPGEAFGSGVVDVVIPDNDPAGIQAPILVDRRRMRVLEAAAQILIDHPSPGDLTVDLVSAEGHRIRLHNQTAAIDPSQVYPLERSEDGPGTIADLASTSANGTWSLVVRDLTPGGEGRLVAWGLYLDMELAPR